MEFDVSSIEVTVAKDMFRQGSTVGTDYSE
jgi:hypothetical protein